MRTSIQVVGYVCKPEFVQKIRKETSHYPFVSTVGIPIYTDLHQCSDVLAFSSVRLLWAYLNRRENHGGVPPAKT